MEERSEELWHEKARQLGIVVIIPTYNNEKTLTTVIEDVLFYVEDIIVVNDGSTDSTPTLLENYPNLHIITHPTNKGKGTALKNGLKQAKAAGYRYAITIDSDGQHFASDIPIFMPWRFVGAVQPAERAVPALLVAAGARPDELVPGGSGRLPALHSGVDLRGHCADGVARRQGVPQQKAGHCLPLPAADDVQRLAGLHGQQPLFLRRTGAKHAAARARRRAGRAALAGHRPQAVGRAGGLLYVPVLRHV